MNLKIYQIFYLPEEHRPHLDPCCIPYDNSNGKSPFFENEVIRILINTYAHTGCDYFGVIAWSFLKKVNIKNPSAYLGIQERINAEPGADIYSFFSHWGRHKPFNHPNSGHPGMWKIAQVLMSRMKLDIDTRNYSVARAIYMNYFIAKPSVYDAYVSEFLIPAMAIMSNPADQEMQQLLWGDSNYKRDVMTDAERARLVSLFGKNFYPWHAFICERLFNVWYSMNFKKYNLIQLT